MDMNCKCKMCNSNFLNNLQNNNQSNQDSQSNNLNKLSISSTLSQSGNSYIDSLSWGGTKWNWSQGSTNKLKYYFGGESTTSPAAITSLNGSLISTANWTTEEKSAMIVGLQLWTNLIGMSIEEVFSVQEANLKFYITTENVGYYGAQFGPYSSTFDGYGIYVRYPGNIWTDSLQPGGFGFITIIHELGHAMGLAHPHDNGGGSLIFPGVSNSGDKGNNNLNQNNYTVMSYIDITSGQNPNSEQSYGFCKGPMALDIATMKYLYGLNPSFNNGNNIYTITDVNQTGTGYSCIYDTNGEDLIIYNGSKKVNIDLRSANIQNNPDGGGYVSKVDDQTVYIGYTISY